MAVAMPKTKKPAPAKPARKPKPAPVPAPKPMQKPGTGPAPPKVQPKLEVGPAGDRFEQEADRTADHAMRMPAGQAGAAAPAIAPVSVQRKALEPPEEVHRGPAQTMPGRHRPTPGPEEREEQQRRAMAGLTLQRAMAPAAAPTPAETTVTPEEDLKKDDCGPPMLAGMQQKSADGSGPAPANVQATVDRARAGGGAPLSPETRADMEGRLGRDFGGVRVHSGGAAAAAAQAVGAKAFTVGNDVFFGAGRYGPQTDGGRRLLAHELVHTVQQGGGSAKARPARLQRDTDADANSQIAQDTPKTDDAKVFDPGDSQLGKIEAQPSEGKAGTMTLPALKLPKVLNGLKATFDHPVEDLRGRPAEGKDKIYAGKRWVYKGRTPRNPNKLAYQTWVEGMLSAGAAEKIRPQIAEVEKAKLQSEIERDGARVYYLIPKKQAPEKATFVLSGTAAEMVDPKRLQERSDPSHMLVVPSWTQTGEFEARDRTKAPYFDADHIDEEQLGGADTFSNMWLWQSSANRSAGSKIAGQIGSQANTLLKAARKAKFWEKAGIKEPDFDIDIRPGWRIEFATVKALDVSYSELHWTRGDVLRGQHLKHLRAMTDTELAEEGLVMVGDAVPKRVHVFTSPNGGARRRLERNRQRKSESPTYRLADRPNGEMYKGFTLDEPGKIPYTIFHTIEQDRDVAELAGHAFRKTKTAEFGQNLTLLVKQSRDLGFGGYVDKKEIRAAIKRAADEAAAKGAGVVGGSPFEVTDAGITTDGELYADGHVTATKALFHGFDFPIMFRGDSVYVDVPIPAAQVDLGPIHVPEAALRLGADENGLFIEGAASLLIDGLGSGRLTAEVGKKGPPISGSFDFDLAFLKDTHAEFEYDYATDAFTVKLEKDVRPGALPGVAGGHVSVTLSRGASGAVTESAKDASAAKPAAALATDGAAGQLGIGLSGELKLAGPLAGAVVEVTWDPKLGIVIAAENIPLPVGKIPGVQDATVSVRASRDAELGVWHLSGTGGAAFQIAGVDGKLLVAVDGAAVTIQGTGGFQKGPAKGSVTILATNLQRGADGTPMPDKPSDSFTVSGKGAAQVQFGKILQGGVGLEVTPEGRVTVAGEVRLPPNFPVFQPAKVDKQLFHVETPDFPIWGVSVAGFGIGVFAFADAYLNFDAFVGPGVITNAHAGVLFDLDRPEDAVVDGCGDFEVAAGAGLTLDIGGGLKVEAGPAEGDGRVGLDGRLGITAKGKAHLGIHWSRQAGLALAAAVEGSASPQFEVNANARLHVSVDLLLGSVGHTWGPWKEPLGKFGPELDFGIKVPVGWSEARGLDFSVDKVAITYPQISAIDMMKAAFDALV